MTALSLVVAVLLAGVLIVLFVPVDFEARGRFATAGAPLLHGRVHARWGGGLVGVGFAPPEPVELSLVGRRVGRFALGGGDPEPKPISPKRSRSRWRPPLRTIVRVTRRAIRSLGLHAGVRGRIGLGDPADTASIYLALESARRLVPSLDTHELAIDWIEPVADVEASLAGRLWPATVLWIVATEAIASRHPAASRRQ